MSRLSDNQPLAAKGLTQTFVLQCHEETYWNHLGMISFCIEPSRLLIFLPESYSIDLTKEADEFHPLEL